MVLPVFGILMIATYLCFFTEEEYDAVKEWMRKRLGHTCIWRFAEGLPGRLSAATWFRLIAGRR